MTRDRVAALARPILCAISDRRRLTADVRAGAGLLPAWAARAVKNGASMIQVRELGMEARDLVSATRAIIDAVAGRALVLVNDRLDVAIAAGADGVHLPAAGVDPVRARQMMSAGLLIGRSVHDVDEAVAADASGACDYLIFGTVFPTASKPSSHAISGLDALREACARVLLPVLAVGGIDRQRLPLVLGAGAAGAAAISLFTDAAAGRHAADDSRTD